MEKEPVRYTVLLMGLLLSARCIFSQDTLCDSLNRFQHPLVCELDGTTIAQRPYVDFEKNQFRFYTEDSKNFRHLYSLFNKLEEGGDTCVHIYHIGGSHLQADIYSNVVREFFHQHYSESGGERGWVFPFNLAGSNSPSNYRFTSPNSWKGYRSVAQKPEASGIDYGLMGYLITSPDSVINLNFTYNRTSSKPSFNKIRIFHNIGEFPYWMNFGADEVLIREVKHDPSTGCTDIWFTDPIDSLDLQFSRAFEIAPELEIYGFVLMNDDPGVSYSSIGVNGAGLYTYLANKRFEDQLKTYPPDLFIYSVGTNDGNVPYSDFDPQVYKRNLEKMMQIALRANPDCALLLTVPNDSYYRRRYLNKNIAREREVIVELAVKYEMAVWDFYGIMGELGSSKTWKNRQLMTSDLVHFTREGYLLKGALLQDAFQKYFNQMKHCSP